jgi:RNA polymerase sigma-70 factor (ECF subfamily)
VQENGHCSGVDLSSQRKIADDFLAALRSGDYDGLLAVLDPDVVVRAESAKGVREIRGAGNWANGALAFSLYARLCNRRC